ncbi:MAG: peptidoglycan-binding protein [bacterium]
MKKSLILNVSICTLVLVGFGGPAVYAQTPAPCVALTADLTSGATDQYPGPVTLLQNYLASAGYLKVKSNGHFGPSTKAAVKAFQKANSITQTGTAGPLTRAALQKKSCTTKTSAAISIPANTPIYSTTLSPNQVATTGTTVPVVPTTPVVANNPVTITSPASGDVLTIGKANTILWNTSTVNPYNLILEQVGGAGAGFIASNLSNGSSYSWKAGNVFSSAAQANQNVATGTYRVRIESTTGGVTSSDPVSGWFTLIAPPLVVTSVTPTSLPADGRTTGVIYGTGFDSSSIVYLDQQYGVGATVNYISPDGTIIVFSIPKVVSVGVHSVLVGNQYGAISNSTSFLVTSGTQ